MITQWDFQQKVDSMIPDLMARVREDARRLCVSGAIDTTKFDNDFILPKLCLIVALENVAQQLDPGPTRFQRGELANLRRF